MSCKEKLLTAEFLLSINPKEYLKYYQGNVRWISVESTQGLIIRFPANLLTPYVTHKGITGAFVLSYWPSGKVQSLEKLAE